MPSGDGFRLPFVVWVLVPTLILLGVQGSLADRIWAPDEWRRWTEPLIGVPGAILAGWTLFIRFGDGTAAPWDLPLNLVVRGPYCHVRNPMITGGDTPAHGREPDLWLMGNRSVAGCLRSPV